MLEDSKDYTLVIVAAIVGVSALSVAVMQLKKVLAKDETLWNV